MSVPSTLLHCLARVAAHDLPRLPEPPGDAVLVERALNLFCQVVPEETERRAEQQALARASLADLHDAGRRALLAAVPALSPDAMRHLLSFLVRVVTRTEQPGIAPSPPSRPRAPRFGP